MLGHITDISKQTRMISFNAHIIASRAGSWGKEFSVVADGIDKLVKQINGHVDKAMKYLNIEDENTKNNQASGTLEEEKTAE